jgi:catabolite regulation protein CreA
MENVLVAAAHCHGEDMGIINNWFKTRDGIKLAIIHNSLLEQYRHLVVSLEKEEEIKSNKPMARLLDEAETSLSCISVGVLQLEDSILKRTIHEVVEASSEYLITIP